MITDRDCFVSEMVFWGEKRGKFHTNARPLYGTLHQKLSHSARNASRSNRAEARAEASRARWSITSQGRFLALAAPEEGPEARDVDLQPQIHKAVSRLQVEGARMLLSGWPSVNILAILSHHGYWFGNWRETWGRPLFTESATQVVTSCLNQKKHFQVARRWKEQSKEERLSVIQRLWAEPFVMAIEAPSSRA